MKTCASVARLKPLLAAHFCRRTYEAVSSILADTERRAGPFATADATYLRCMCAADAAVTQVHRPWILYISKWVDYSNKYGFGFQLSDNSVGIMFNDDTRMVLTADNASVHTAALLSPRRGGAGIKRFRDPPVRPSVRLSVSAQARPPELCGLRIGPRTDVDPPRSAGGISSRRAITCLFFQINANVS